MAAVIIRSKYLVYVYPFRNHGFGFQTRLRLAWPRGCFDNCTCFAFVLRASDERTEPEAEAVDSKRAIVLSLFRSQLQKQ